MNILVIDTSNHVLGVAIMKNEQLIGQIVTNLSKNHSARLMPAVNKLMEEVELSVQDLDRIVVAKGPGSYTGVRIGVTTAKTLAWALQIPIVGVSSLEALAYQGHLFDGLICPFFDARRGMVYTGLYEWDKVKLTTVEIDKNILFDEVLNQLRSTGERILFLSPDIAKFEEKIKNILGEMAVIPASPYHITNPSHLGLASLHYDPEETHDVTPNYLRLAEAESNWLKQQKENENNV